MKREGKKGKTTTTTTTSTTSIDSHETACFFIYYEHRLRFSVSAPLWRIELIKQK